MIKGNYTKLINLIRDVAEYENDLTTPLTMYSTVYLHCLQANGKSNENLDALYLSTIEDMSIALVDTYAPSKYKELLKDEQVRKTAVLFFINKYEVCVEIVRLVLKNLKEIGWLNDLSWIDCLYSSYPDAADQDRIDTLGIIAMDCSNMAFAVARKDFDELEEELYDAYFNKVPFIASIVYWVTCTVMYAVATKSDLFSLL